MSCESYEHLYDKNWTYIFFFLQNSSDGNCMLSQKKKKINNE